MLIWAGQKTQRSEEFMPLISNARSQIPDYRNPLFTVYLVVYLSNLGLEFYALILAIEGDLKTALVLHFISSMVIPWSLCAFMPRHFQSNIKIISLLFLLCFFIPIISSLCLLLSLTVALYYTKPHKVEVFEYSEPIKAEAVISDVLSKPDYCNGRIFGVLRFSTDDEKRIKAVLATNQIADASAIPILHVALLDSVDEVRLLAYSILNNKEKDIDVVINRGLKQLKSTIVRKEIRAIHHKLAEAYWELSYLGLVKGRARDHILHSAKKHAEQAIRFQSKDMGLFLLLVQILTSLGYFLEASSLLKRIRRDGGSVEKLAARNAELAFELKRFSKVSEHVKEIDKLAKNNVVLDGMVKQWN